MKLCILRGKVVHFAEKFVPLYEMRYILRENVKCVHYGGKFVHFVG